MSELVPFFSDDEVLDDNLLRSIETLLDDNEHNLDGINREHGAPVDNGMFNSAPSSPMPQFQPMNGSFSFGNQVYQKWSTNDSGEMANMAPKRNYGRNPSRASSNFVKPVKKNAPAANGMPATRVNIQIAQYQAMLAEKANQLLTQYLRLNYDFLNAQAQILGIPLEQYIRNLLIALNNQSLCMMPNQPLMFGPMNPLQSMTSPTIAQQRAFTKPYFNKKN